VIAVSEGHRSPLAGEDLHGFVAEKRRLEAKRVVARPGEEQNLAGMQQRRVYRQWYEENAPEFTEP